jgi:sulfotransferase family protein
MLPNFLIVGAPKAGTTSIAAYLDGHPDVFIAREKEVHFFDQHFENGPDWYRGRFEGAQGERAVGEASPTYMNRDEWVARMAELLPDAKLIAVLRNPVDRAYSHYWWMRALYERRTFAEGARAEMSGAEDPPRFGYLAEGRYVEHLERLCRWYPRTSLAVVILEEMRRAPEEGFSALCRFLDIDDSVKPAVLGAVMNRAYRLRFPRLRVEMMRFHAWDRLPRGWAERIDLWNRVPFSYPPMDPEIRSELEAYFSRYNAALEAWLGRALPVWETHPVPTTE